MSIFNFLLSDSNKAILIAAMLGSLFGFEREIARKDPSLRTFMLISVGSCLFTLVSIQAAKNVAGADPGRIAAQIVVGIGFLGAGTIFRSRDRVVGLTTAALIWVTAALGCAVGFGQIELACSGAITCLFFMISLALFHRIFRKLFPEKPIVSHEKVQNRE